MRYSSVLLVFVCLIVALSAGQTFAQSPAVPAEDTVQDMSSKLSRGVFNILTGWGELPRQMVISGKEKGWWAPVVIGIPAGAIMTVVRTGTGVFETACFYIPINDSYGPMLDPAFVWQKAAE
jgi:putative exosortase-associated protein (TIGR04073 family)